MKTVCAIFSYERYAGLVNAVTSIRRHFPMMDVIIVDDGSSDPRITAYCKDQMSKETVVDFHVRTGAKTKGRRVGGLYENMQYALDWALAHGYDLMLTMQDDMQCLWGDGSVLDEVARFFQKCGNAIFLQSRFCKRAVYFDQYRYNDDLDAYRIKRACNAVGFYSLTRLRGSGFCFGTNERESSENAGKLGFCGYQMASPVLADIPLRAGNMREFVLGRADFDFSDAPDEKAPVLCDLRPADISHLRTRDRKIPPFGEDYVHRSDGADLIFPHWFNRNAPERYAEVLKATYELERASNSVPIQVPRESAADNFGKKVVTRTGSGAMAKFWSAATKRSRYISIAEYFIRKTRLLLFFYLEYAPIRRWFINSSRKLSEG